ncbi:MAG TPA: aminotransferase class V-fold PLP-dependent enzyme [Acidimicrobiales bacterium]|jgi:glutamate/tyrosine decarboxylase-like PLP-dependent enzyme|nr:aminotransferase class V-fold PLP-dependent enzyme [Acidimicrobiales bacterium]
MSERRPDVRLPAHGLDADRVLARMDELRGDDRDWRGGRVFSLVYSAGDAVHDLLQRAATLYSAENALNTAVFPSLGRMQQDIISITAGLLGADRLPPDEREGVRGFLTSGGTESLLQATRTARDWGRSERGIDRPNMVLATSAHAAFEKASHYFDVESRRVPVRDDFSADTDALADAVDDRTVMVVASAPSYPQGVVDPVPDIAAMASERGILCHVDACLGGFILPFLSRLGHLDKRWDLTVAGVTSISADLHKYGYATKGVSVILYRHRRLAGLQPFVTTNWLGGLYGSPSMAGTRPAGPIAAGWAVLHHLGADGYLRLAEDAHQAAAAIKGAINDTAGLALRGSPDATVFAFGADPDDGRIDTFALGDALADRGGWFFDRQTPPDSLHATVQAGHLAVTGRLRADLTAVAGELRSSGRRAAERGATYGTV